MRKPPAKTAAELGVVFGAWRVDVDTSQKPHLNWRLPAADQPAEQADPFEELHPRTVAPSRLE